MKTLPGILTPLRHACVGALLVSLTGCETGPVVPPTARVLDHILRDENGITVRNAQGATRVEIWSDGIIRVRHARSVAEASAALASFAVVAKPQPPAWTFHPHADGTIELGTAALRVTIAAADGSVAIRDREGRTLLAERAGGAVLTPTRVGIADTLASGQSFHLDAGEAIYGFGQQQDGVMNHVGTRVHLQQKNAHVGVPSLLSSKGYALLWDNPAVTDVDIGATDRGILTWTSEASHGINYYFFNGPAPDQAIAAYRRLTGAAPLPARWTWGLWQSRERYSSQKELLGVLAEYRRRGLPLDGVIQDWQYWEAGQWGAHTFDPKRFPDPTAMVKAVHDAHAHTIISVWPRFDVGTAHHAELEKAGALYPPVYPNVYPKGEGRWYDAFNPEARRLYWRQIATELGSRGFDGWWLDASEAELGGKWGELRDLRTGSGPGAEVFNAYPLLHTTAVYEGQRADAPDRRAFILTRSAYAGQQRNGAVTWSGDIHGDWSVFKKQLPAGLNFVATGIPYWNTDIGGFFGGDPADANYAELFTRWFQFGTFCPMLRIHGTGKPKEIWRFDAATQEVLANYLRLRYHLLPYLYSVSWRVTDEGYTLMRPLVMDFRADPQVLDIADQYMFGPSLLVCPVVEPGAETRPVYLPAGVAWTDFWTGAVHAGGQRIETAAPIGTLPLFVRAGSLLPYGPEVQYADEKPDAPIELRVYRGADGAFTLYEDDGLTHAYETGRRALIPITWDESARTLTFGARQGTFPGLVAKRSFRVVWVRPGQGVDVKPTETPDVVVAYEGRAVKIRSPR